VRDHAGEIGGAECLQCLPAEGGQHCTRHEVASLDHTSSEQAERGDEQPDVGQDRGKQHERTDQAAEVAVKLACRGGDTGERRRDDQAGTDEHHERQASQPGTQRIGPLVARNCPHPVERVLRGLADAQHAVEENKAADHDRSRVSLDR